MNTNYMQRHGIDHAGATRIDSTPEARNNLAASDKLHIKYVLPIACSSTEGIAGIASVASIRRS